MTEEKKIEILSTLHKKFPFHINEGVVDFRVKKMMQTLDSFDFDVFLPTKNMHLQRPLVWSKEQKEGLILTMLKRQPWGKVTVVRHDKEDGTLDGYYEVIDGKQRLTTIISFINDEFPIFVEGYSFYYSDLPENHQKIIYFAPVFADVAYSYESEPISDDEKIALFEHVNWLGTPQDQEHMENLRKAKK